MLMLIIVLMLVIELEELGAQSPEL